MIVHPNAELIRKFYTSFGNRDARGMAACYHPAVRFSDEVFTDLEGAREAGMWQMLCERAKELKVEFRDIEADDTTGRAHWEAWYTFSATGRPVHNQIDARFEFREEKSSATVRASIFGLGIDGGALTALGVVPASRKVVEAVRAHLSG